MGGNGVLEQHLNIFWRHPLVVEGLELSWYWVGIEWDAVLATPRTVTAKNQLFQNRNSWLLR